VESALAKAIEILLLSITPWPLVTAVPRALQEAAAAAAAAAKREWAERDP
jgi:hypothetical protein